MELLKLFLTHYLHPDIEPETDSSKVHVASVNVHLPSKGVFSGLGLKRRASDQSQQALNQRSILYFILVNIVPPENMRITAHPIIIPNSSDLY